MWKCLSVHCKKNIYTVAYLAISYVASSFKIKCSAKEKYRVVARITAGFCVDATSPKLQLFDHGFFVTKCNYGITKYKISECICELSVYCDWCRCVRRASDCSRTVSSTAVNVRCVRHAADWCAVCTSSAAAASEDDAASDTCFSKNFCHDCIIAQCIISNTVLHSTLSHGQVIYDFLVYEPSR